MGAGPVGNGAIYPSCRLSYEISYEICISMYVIYYM